MPAEALDMALDDLVQGDRGRGRGSKGKGKGKKSKGKSFQIWGGSKVSSEGKGGRGKGAKKTAAEPSEDAKLDMSLDEVIEKTGGKGKGQGGKNRDAEGKGKGRAKGKNDGGNNYSGNSWGGGKNKGGGYGKGGNSWNDDGYYSKGSKGYKGYSKGGKSWDNGKGKDRGQYSSPAWNEHDDRDDDYDGGDDWRGKGSWGSRGGKGMDDGPRDRMAGRVRASGDGWQRVEQPRAPIRDSRRASPPPRREERGRDVGRSSKVVESRGLKRRAAEEPENSRSIKSIKVTNIPRNVNMDDIKDAFQQETGKIARCRLDRGTAWIAFLRASDAQKAIETFDRGELNGQTIGVALDP